jgi:uncharacterized protein YjbJ (UPF0337 family)
MDKDRIKGKVQDISGRAKRQVGEWTGDEETQAEGTVEQGEGKVRQVVGKVKDKAREGAEKLRERAASRRKKDEAA